MHRTPRLTRALSLLLLLSGGTALSAAAQQADDPPPPEKASTEQTQQDPAVQTIPAAGIETETTDDIPSPEEENTNSSPFDYEPSEEISEDLAVSFPVDI